MLQCQWLCQTACQPATGTGRAARRQIDAICDIPATGRYDPCPARTAGRAPAVRIRTAETASKLKPIQGLGGLSGRRETALVRGRNSPGKRAAGYRPGRRNARAFPRVARVRVVARWRHDARSLRGWRAVDAHKRPRNALSHGEHGAHGETPTPGTGSADGVCRPVGEDGSEVPWATPGRDRLRRRTGSTSSAGCMGPAE